MVAGVIFQPGQPAARLVEEEYSLELVLAPTQHRSMAVKIVLDLPKKQEFATRILATFRYARKLLFKNM